MAQNIKAQYAKHGKTLTDKHAFEEVLAQVSSAINTKDPYQFLVRAFGDVDAVSALFELSRGETPRRLLKSIKHLAMKFVNFFKRLFHHFRLGLGLRESGKALEAADNMAEEMQRGDVLTVVRQLQKSASEEISVRDDGFRLFTKESSKEPYESKPTPFLLDNVAHN